MEYESSAQINFWLMDKPCLIIKLFNFTVRIIRYIGENGTTGIHRAVK